MKIYVEVQKDYYSKRDPAVTETVKGLIAVEAPSEGDAIDLVDGLMNTDPILQTIDPRIKWEEGSIKDPVYQDWTFCTSGEAYDEEDVVDVAIDMGVELGEAIPA